MRGLAILGIETNMPIPNQLVMPHDVKPNSLGRTGRSSDRHGTAGILW